MTRKIIQKVIMILDHHDGWISYIPPELQDEFESVHDEILRAEALAEKQWRSEYNQRHKDIREMKKSVDSLWAKRCRVRYLEGQRRETIEALRNNKDRQVDAVREDDQMSSERLYQEFELLSKRLRGNECALKAINSNNKDIITDEMIENARNYPITNLLMVDSRGFAQCIAHDDSRPSMYCKKNFVHCFACDYHGDAIDVCMKINSMTFPQAVKFLQS